MKCMLTFVVESSVARSRSYERWRQRTASPRDSGPRKDQPGGEAHAVRRTNTKLNEDTRQGNEREREGTRGNGSSLVSEMSSVDGTIDSPSRSQARNVYQQHKRFHATLRCLFQ